MEIGIGLPNATRGVRGPELVAWAREAEQAGFSSLATTVLLAPLRTNTALFAKQAASVDGISEGRLVLGLAVGGREDDYTVSGVDFHTRGRRFEQMLEQWRRVWAGESFGFA